jgi:hypothetical protein
VEGSEAAVRGEIDNWLLRLFAPYVDAVYDIDTRQLVRYEGTSNLADASGSYKKVTSTCRYDCPAVPGVVLHSAVGGSW